MCKYRLEVQTSDVRKAGTSGSVYVTLTGDLCTIGELHDRLLLDCQHLYLKLGCVNRVRSCSCEWPCLLPSPLHHPALQAPTSSATPRRSTSSAASWMCLRWMAHPTADACSRSRWGVALDLVETKGGSTSPVDRLCNADQPTCAFNPSPGRCATMAQGVATAGTWPG